jgi:hypothetical protein
MGYLTSIWCWLVQILHNDITMAQTMQTIFDEKAVSHIYISKLGG